MADIISSSIVHVRKIIKMASHEPISGFVEVTPSLASVITGDENHLLTCLRNSSSAISPWATANTSLMTASLRIRSMSHRCPRVSSDSTQLTRRRRISCFQWRSLTASDFSSTTIMFAYTHTRTAGISQLNMLLYHVGLHTQQASVTPVNAGLYVVLRCS